MTLLKHMINRNIDLDFDANTRAVTSQNGLNRSDQAGCGILRGLVGDSLFRCCDRPIVIGGDGYWLVNQYRSESPMCAYQGLTQKLQGVGHV